MTITNEQYKRIKDYAKELLLSVVKIHNDFLRKSMHLAVKQSALDELELLIINNYENRDFVKSINNKQLLEILENNQR